MSVHAHSPARETLPLRVDRRIPLQVLWVLGGLVLGFGVPFVLADLARDGVTSRTEKRRSR
jgi:hypothetical protein